MSADISLAAIAWVCAALRDWEQCDEGVNNDAREEAADMLEALAARVAELKSLLGRTALREAGGVTEAEAREAKLREALASAAESLGWAEAHLKDAGVKSAQVTFGERAARAALQETKP